jgi:uncharacterized protein YecT (DUF1311 family)
LKQTIAAVVFLLPLLIYAEKEPMEIARAPSGDYKVVSGHGGLEAVSQSGSESAKLPLPQGKTTSSGEPHDHQQSLAFISPDGNWIFVPTDEEILVESRLQARTAPAVLFHRTAAMHFDSVNPSQFDQKAWEFLDHELKIAHPNLPTDTIRIYSAKFVAWSPDSKRLLIRVGGGAISPSKDSWVESGSAAASWYLYFNAASAQFELTERLRAADQNPKRISFDASDIGGLVATEIDAEPIGDEKPQPAFKQDFDAADKRLNAIYEKLVARLDIKAREQLRDEQRAWLVSRDVAAEIAVLQTWSEGGEALARQLVCKTAATNTRVEELAKRLPP